MVKQKIVGSGGTCVATHLPGRKVEITLPGAKHRVVVAVKHAGIFIINPDGAVTNIEIYSDETELLRHACQTREGLQLAAVFVPVIAAEGETNDAENG